MGCSLVGGLVGSYACAQKPRTLSEMGSRLLATAAPYSARMLSRRDAPGRVSTSARVSPCLMGTQGCGAVCASSSAHLLGACYSCARPAQLPQPTLCAHVRPVLNTPQPGCRPPMQQTPHAPASCS